MIIPALNEEESLPGVLRDIPDWVDRVVVVDNGSTDGTFAAASAKGLHPNAVAVREPARGYGNACLRGMKELEPSASGAPGDEGFSGEDVVVFLDADHSDDPREMARLVGPVAAGEADFTLADRFTASLEPGALTAPQRFGNKLAVALIFALWGGRYGDLGPFRAIRKGALDSLRMGDRNYGWTVEMQVKALSGGLRVREIGMPYRNRRGGVSKVSGTLRGVLGAGLKILAVIVACRLSTLRRPVRRR